MARVKIGELLLEAGAITQEHVVKALQAQHVYGGRLGTNLMALGFITEEDLTRTLSEQLGIPAAPADALANVPDRVLEIVTPTIATTYQVVPFAADREKRLLDAVFVDPSDLPAVDTVSFHTGMKIRPYLASETLVLEALERYYHFKPERNYIRLIEGRPQFPAPPAAADGNDDWADIVDLPEVDPEPHLDPTERLAAAAKAIWGDALPSEHDDAPEDDDGYLYQQPKEDKGDLRTCVRRLEAAAEDMEIVEVVLDFAETRFQKQYVFSEKDGGLEIVRARGPEDAQALLGKTFPLSDENLLTEIHRLPRTHLGPLPPVSDNHDLMDALGEEVYAPVVLMPIACQGRADLVYLALGMDASFDGLQIRRLSALVERAGVARDIRALRRRLRDLPEDL